MREKIPTMSLRSPDKDRLSLRNIARPPNLKRTDEGSTETPELPTCCINPPPLLFQHGCRVFSQLTLRLVTVSVSTFQCLLPFRCSSSSLGCKARHPPRCLISLSGVTFANHSLHWASFFLSPKQLTTVFSAMV